MTPDSLRKSIFKRAFEGKLVDNLVSEKPIPLKTVRSDIDLPENWICVYIEDITNSIPSKQFQIKESEVKQSGNNIVISQSKDYSIGYSDCDSKVYKHIDPVIVFGDHTASVKFVEFDFVIGADGLKIFEPITKYVDAKYLYFVLLYNADGLDKIGGYSRHYKYLKEKIIPLPSLEEQKRIVAKIEELLPLVDRYEEAWNKLELLNKKFPVDMEKSILNFAVKGKLVKGSDSSGIELYNKIVDHKKELNIANKKHLESNNESFPFDIPENWKWCRFGEVVDYRMGKTPPRAESEWWTNDIPWISIGDMIENGHVSNTKEKVSNSALRIKFGGTISPKGTLIMSFKLTVGRVSILDMDAVHNEAIISIFPYIDKLNTFRDYLFYTLPFLSQFGEAKGAIKGNTLNDTSLCNLPIPLPSFEEQKRIVAKLEELLPLCRKLVK